MDITTAFDLVDTVYAIEDAQQGKLIPLTVIKVDISVITVEVTTIIYTVRNNQKFNGSQYEEGELAAYAEALVIQEAAVQVERDEIQRQIDNL